MKDYSTWYTTKVLKLKWIKTIKKNKLINYQNLNQVNTLHNKNQIFTLKSIKISIISKQKENNKMLSI